MKLFKNEATLDGLVHGELDWAGKWLLSQIIEKLWARPIAFWPGLMVVIVQKKIFLFAFQAILNTFSFWVKNLEKKYSKSQLDTLPPPPSNWKNIL